MSYLAAVSGGLLQASFFSWKSKRDEGEDLKFTDAPQVDDSTTERTRWATTAPTTPLTTTPAIKTRGEVTLRVLPKMLLTLVTRLTFGRSAFGFGLSLELVLVCLELALLAIFLTPFLMYLNLRASLVVSQATKLVLLFVAVGFTGCAQAGWSITSLFITPSKVFLCGSFTFRKFVNLNGSQTLICYSNIFNMSVF